VKQDRQQAEVQPSVLPQKNETKDWETGFESGLAPAPESRFGWQATIVPPKRENEEMSRFKEF
jgi:hypothetical protein